MITEPEKSNAQQKLQRVVLARSSVVRFMEVFFSEEMLDKILRNNWRRFDEYFQVLASFAQNGFAPMRYLIQNQNAIIRLLEFVMNSSSPFHTSKIRMGDRMQEPNFTQVVEILSLLIRSCFTPGIKEMNQYSPDSLFQTEDKHIEIPFEKDYSNFPLMCTDCFTSDLLLKANPNNDSLQKLVVHLSWGDLKTSTFFVTEIMSAIRSRRSTEDLKYHLKILASLMALADDIQHQRLNIIFNFHEGKYVPPAE